MSAYLTNSLERKKMKLITLHLPEPYIQALDNLVDEKYYPNRAEAIRTAVRDLLSIEAWGRSRNG
jgi:antitoxin ParD1/3/4